jgi:hypothetical protein
MMRSLAHVCGLRTRSMTSGLGRLLGYLDEIVTAPSPHGSRRADGNRDHQDRACRLPNRPPAGQ